MSAKVKAERSSGCRALGYHIGKRVTGTTGVKCDGSRYRPIGGGIIQSCGCKLGVRTALGGKPAFWLKPDGGFVTGPFAFGNGHVGPVLYPKVHLTGGAWVDVDGQGRPVFASDEEDGGLPLEVTRIDPGDMRMQIRYVHELYLAGIQNAVLSRQNGELSFGFDDAVLSWWSPQESETTPEEPERRPFVYPSELAALDPVPWDRPYLWRGETPSPVCSEEFRQEWPSPMAIGRLSPGWGDSNGRPYLFGTNAFPIVFRGNYNAALMTITSGVEPAAGFLESAHVVGNGYHAYDDQFLPVIHTQVGSHPQNASKGLAGYSFDWSTPIVDGRDTKVLERYLYWKRCGEPENGRAMLLEPGLPGRMFPSLLDGAVPFGTAVDLLLQVAFVKSIEVGLTRNFAESVTVVYYDGYEDTVHDVYWYRLEKGEFRDDNCYVGGTLSQLVPVAPKARS